MWTSTWQVMDFVYLFAVITCDKWKLLLKHTYVCEINTEISSNLRVWSNLFSQNWRPTKWDNWSFRIVNTSHFGRQTPSFSDHLTFERSFFAERDGSNNSSLSSWASFSGLTDKNYCANKFLSSKICSYQFGWCFFTVICVRIQNVFEVLNNFLYCFFFCKFTQSLYTFQCLDK